MYSPVQRQFLVFGELYDTIPLSKDAEGEIDSSSLFISYRTENY